MFGDRYNTGSSDASALSSFREGAQLSPQPFLKGTNVHSAGGHPCEANTSWFIQDTAGPHTEQPLIVWADHKGMIPHSTDVEEFTFALILVLEVFK